VTLASTPTANVREGQEVVEVYSSTPSESPVNFLLRARSGTAMASSLLQKQKDQLVLVTGELLIEDKNTTVLNLRTMNDAFDGQFINEANITGRVCKDAKAAEKSSSVNVAVNRYSVVNGASKESTDYFRVRGYGKLKDRFEKLSKGSLIELSGMVVTMRNREGAEYIELKARFMQVHSKSKGGVGGGGNPAPKSNAVGMDDSDFLGDDMPFS
tara:strand:+ start:430 stop:1068 length:639 start_codon:yes stop_codon:yes gene_type:complete